MSLRPSKMLLLGWGGEFILRGIGANTWQLLSLGSLGSPGPGQLSRMRPSISWWVLSLGKVDLGISWDESRSTGGVELSIPRGTTSPLPSRGLSTLRDRCHHGAGYVPRGWVWGCPGRCFTCRIHSSPPHTCSQDDAFGLDSPNLHALQPGWAAESRWAGGERGGQGTFPPPVSPRRGETHQNAPGGRAPGTPITRAPSLMGHPH